MIFLKEIVYFGVFVNFMVFFYISGICCCFGRYCYFISLIMNRKRVFFMIIVVNGFIWRLLCLLCVLSGVEFIYLFFLEYWRYKFGFFIKVFGVLCRNFIYEGGNEFVNLLYEMFMVRREWLFLSVEGILFVRLLLERLSDLSWFSFFMFFGICFEKFL